MTAAKEELENEIIIAKEEATRIKEDCASEVEELSQEIELMRSKMDEEG